MKNLDKVVEYLKNRDEIVFAYLYGSSLEGEGRDVDIGIYVNEKIPEDKELDFSLSLSAKIFMEYEVPVDIRVINHAPLGFLKNVLSGKLLFSKDERLRENFIERVSFEYMEFYELSKMFFKEVFDV